MLRTGAEYMFTGESGSVTYLFVLLLLSLSCICRAIAARREGGRKELGALSSGLALFVAARVFGLYSMRAGSEALSLFAAVSGLFGLYLMMTSIVSGRRKGDYSPIRKTVIGAGLIAGVVLGGAGLLLRPISITGPAAVATGHMFAAAVPAGLIAGMLIDKRRRSSGGWPAVRAAGGFFLGAASAILLSAAAVVSALAWSGLGGSGTFTFQFGALLDVAGMFLFLAWLTLEPAGRRVADEAPAADAPAPVTPGVKVLEISRSVVDGKRDIDVYREIAESICEETGANFVVIRASGEGDERLEVKGFYAEENESRSPSFAMSLTRERLAEYCVDTGTEDGVFVLDAKTLGEDRAAFVPSSLADVKGSVAVMPVREADDDRAVVVAGFFRDGLPAIVPEVLKAYGTNVMQIAGRETWSDRTRKREKELALCKEELESVNQMKSNFLSIVSHELRTPLTSVKAYTETLMDNVETIESDTVRDFLKVMGEENDRVITLVDNILNYSCMESGHLKVEKAECDIGELIEEVHAGLENRMLTGRVNSDVKLPRGKVVVDADRELIRQMLNNLISNAIKFTPEGGRVTVVLEEEASAARIVVQDTGRGIPEDQLEKIFERFHQVDASDTREHGGSGLGLAICKNIVEWHDGNIWVENVKEAGAKFTVMLPMKDIIVRHAVSSGFIGSVRFERERFLTLLTEMLSGFLQARKASIMLFDPRDRTLQVIAAKGLDPEFVQNTRIEVGERIAGKVFAEEEALHVFDIERDSKVSRSNNTAFYWTKSFISVPLRDGDDVIGVLNVADHVDNRGFTDADREILESLGPVISGMVKKLDAYETVSSNFEKLKDAMKSILHIREIWGSKNMLNFTMIAMSVARRLNLDEKSLTALRMGMSMYDLGMMKIPRSLRMKKESLSEKEWEKLREHPDLGYSLVSPMGLDERIMKMVRNHHEHFDGSGYPAGLIKDEIPVEARILNVVDSFRALISPGPYRRCFSIDEAKNEIIQGAGTLFDPKVVGAFVKSLHDLGARDDRCELVLEAVEKELEEKALEHEGEEAIDKEEIKETEEELETVKEGS
jgi:signal transduction histidine kinase/HD-GYP domain-containing protein (c-di-GMP phosphodiesterase class II)